MYSPSTPNILESVTSRIEQEGRRVAHADTPISMTTEKFGDPSVVSGC